MQLKDKVAYITGSASGIGKEIAILFAQEGAKIIIADLNKEAADATAAELKATGAQAIGVGVDVTNEDQVNASVEEGAAAFGGIDILISNAGIQIVHPVEEFSFADWKKMLAIHLDGAFLTTKACLKHMYAQGRGGSVIYMGSVHSKEASLLKAPYVTAKLGISEQEVIKNVMLKETVDGEFTTTEDVARVALLFAGFPTNALTGQSLVVSHGWFMQ
jgi:3-hydroxybutyrate dehydrogenase